MAKPNLSRAIGNEVATTLAGSITDTDTSIDVANSTGFEATGGYAIIDEGISGKEEVVYVEDVTGNTLTVSSNGRGLEGTSAVAHDTGATITDILVANHINSIIDHLDTEHNDDGTHSEITATSVTSVSLALSGDAVIDGSVTAGSIVTDSISESTPDAGITADGVLLKDGQVTGDHVMEIGVSAVLSAPQAIDTSTWDTIIFDLEDYDVGEDYDNTTGIFTVPLTGKYLISAHAAIGALTAGKQAGLRILKGTSTVLARKLEFMGTSEATTQELGFTRSVLLTSGDVIKIQAYHDVGTQQNIGGASGAEIRTWVSIDLLGV